MDYASSMWSSSGAMERTSAISESTVCRSRRLFESGADYLEIFDAAHSEFEDRFVAIGPIDRGLVVVVYTEREDDLIRIIGARLANKREQALYRSYMGRYK
jgi:uncharacterized DUF497 family protein